MKKYKGKEAQFFFLLKRKQKNKLIFKNRNLSF